MNQFKRFAALATVSAMLSTGFAIAQDQHGDQGHPAGDQGHQAYVRHPEWHKGARISHDDWARGQQVDWRAHHLRQPPSGYEWREVDGNYVLAAVATGLIASAIVASTGH